MTVLNSQTFKITLNLSDVTQNKLDCNLGAKNTVWRRLRRAKKDYLTKNKFLENWARQGLNGG